MENKKVGINILRPSNSVVETTELQLADNMGGGHLSANAKSSA